MSLTIKGLHRLGLWVLLLILTGTILIFPTHLTFEYYTIQSTRIFANLPLFATLFWLWGAVLFLLLFSKRNSGKRNWENLALIGIFSAVFLGFWTIITHVGLSNEGIYNAAHVKFLNETGFIPLAHQDLGYFDFPSLHLIGSFVSQVILLDPLNSAALIVFSQAVILAFLLYTLFKQLLNNPYVAALGAILAIQGNISLDKINIFHPRNLGLILLTVFLILITKYMRGKAQIISQLVLLLIVAAATTMTHAVTSFLLFFIICSVFIIQRIGRGKTIEILAVVLVGLLPLFWFIYYATQTSTDLFRTFPQIISDYIQGGNIFWIFSMLGSANVGGSYPLWANVTRLFWWITIYGLGSIIGVFNLVKIRKLNNLQHIALGVLLGIIIVSSFSILASVGGGRFDTYILYGAFATIPILMTFILIFRERFSKVILFSIISLAFLLSLPSFLAHNNMVEFDAYYPNEHATGRFMESQYGKGNNIHLSGVTWLQLLTAYYIPASTRTLVREVLYLENEAGLWADFDRVLDNYEGGGDSLGRNVIFIWSKRVVLPYEHFFNVSQDNPIWKELIERLDEQNKIYNNGNSLVYLLAI